MAFKKIGNIRDGMPSQGASSVQAAPRMKKVGNIKTGFTSPRIAQAPQIDRQAKLKEIIAKGQPETDRLKKEADWANSKLGFAVNTVKAMPQALADVTIGNIARLGVSAVQTPFDVAKGEFSDKQFKIPGLSPFKTFQRQIGETQQDVIEDKKGLGSLAWDVAQVPLAGLEAGGAFKGISKGVQAYKSAPTAIQGLKKATPEVIDAFLPTTRGTGVNRKLASTTKSPSPIQIPKESGDGLTTRGFAKNLAKDENTPKSVYENIPGYEKITDEQTLTRAAQEINADPNKAIQDVITGGVNTDKVHNAKAQQLIRKLIEDGNEDLAHQVATATSKNATEAGRSVQIFAAYHKTTPEGALRNTYKMIDDFKAKNPDTPISLSPEKAQEITKLAEEVQKYKQGTREWQVAAALLEKAKSQIIPVSNLGKLNKIQTMAQLMNPKTLIRNIGGNAALDIMEDASRSVAAGIDKALFKLGFINERNVLMPNVKTNWLAKATGFKQGVEDVNLGIKTKGASGQYDIMQDAFKQGSIMNKLEKALGYELSTFDKAFYEGRYASSLENIMQAKGVTKPTEIMKDMADAEALYATFQNNSRIAKALSGFKGTLNAGKEWGLGDLIMKYPKTPGNIVSVGMDYSPIGFIKGLKQFRDSTKFLSPSLQREAIINLGRGITGSGLILGGAMLAKQGILTSDPEKDPDIRQLKRESGQGPFSFNVTALDRLLSGEDTKARNGDTILSYDWLQPNAIQLSMGANMVLNKGDAGSQINAALESLSAGVDTATTQPVFSGAKRFIGNLDTSKGGGVVKAFSEALAGAPASFTPSVLNQVGQYMDNTQRETYDPNMAQQSFNKIQARLPIAREGLQPRVGVMGEELKGYQNPSLLNVFLNPAFVNKYNVSPAAQEVIDIYSRSGETKQTPRLAQKSVKIDGENYELTPQQYNQYQTYIGQRTNEEFTSLISDPEFQSLSDTQKANEMSSLLTNIGKEGRDELSKTGGLAPSVEMQAKTFLKSGDMDGYVEFVREHPELNTKADFTRLMNEIKTEGYSKEDKAIVQEIAKRKKQKANQPFFKF